MVETAQLRFSGVQCLTDKMASPQGYRSIPFLLKLGKNLFGNPELLGRDYLCKDHVAVHIGGDLTHGVLALHILFLLLLSPIFYEIHGTVLVVQPLQRQHYIELSKFWSQYHRDNFILMQTIHQNILHI